MKSKDWREKFRELQALAICPQERSRDSNSLHFKSRNFTFIGNIWYASLNVVAMGEKKILGHITWVPARHSLRAGDDSEFHKE